jgi:protein O-GlcNAc transferase
MSGAGEAFGRRGLALLEEQRFAEAEEALRQAVALNPGDVIALNALGVVVLRLGRGEAAIEAFRVAIGVRPEFADAHSNLGHALTSMGRFVEAEAACRAALAVQPDRADAWNNLGNALKAQDRLEEAVAVYRQAIGLRSDLADAHHNLAPALTELGRADEAIAAYCAAMDVPGCYAKARFGLCMAQLPILCTDEAELARRHAGYARELEALEANVAGHPEVDFGDAVGAHQPFYLAYHGRNEGALQRRYGELVCRVMAARDVAAVMEPRAGRDCVVAPLRAMTGGGRPADRIRVGIVSGYFVHHSVWKIPISGWVRQLDRARFQVFGYHTGSWSDDVSALAATLCDRFVSGSQSVAAWREAILADAPQVLIYPEIGMDPVAGALAAMRLALVQCNAIGHPITSGMPTIDYFLTSDVMEPEGTEDEYTERLVCLPGLSVYYDPLEVPPLALSRTELRLRVDATVYWCGQSLYKYLPRHDEIFPRIAAAAGDTQFVFIEHGSRFVTALFRMRLEQAFAALGLRATDHCVLLPRMDIQRFLAVMGVCDVFLDSLGWSGFNTAMESLAHALPIVTLPGETMRTRHSSGVLRQIGVTETIATSEEEYVGIATRLAREPAWRSAVGERMRTHRAKAWRDPAAIRGLEAFLERAVIASEAKPVR